MSAQDRAEPDIFAKTALGLELMELAKSFGAKVKTEADGFNFAEGVSVALTRCGLTLASKAQSQPAAAPVAVETKGAQRCGTCGGNGMVDSGGATPWGEWIQKPCPECSTTEHFAGKVAESDRAHTAWIASGLPLSDRASFVAGWLARALSPIPCGPHVPAWAKEDAENVAGIWAQKQRVENIARALTAAYARGREDAAKVCDRLATGIYPDEVGNAMRSTAERCAAEIRAPRLAGGL